MSGKGSDSRMSDECLMKGKSGTLYFGEYQAGTRKFTLALKSFTCSLLDLKLHTTRSTCLHQINQGCKSFA